MAQILESLSVLWVAPWQDSLAGVLWALWLGILLATCYAWYRRMTLGKALDALLKDGCDSPEKAKSARELCLSPAAAKALQRERMIRKAGEGFYLPPESQKKAQAVNKVGSIALWQIPLVALGAYAALVVAYHIIPLL